jgi:hypothetical protein
MAVVVVPQVVPTSLSLSLSWQPVDRPYGKTGWCGGQADPSLFSLAACRWKNPPMKTGRPPRGLPPCEK